jgi:hypothetical protein
VEAQPFASTCLSFKWNIQQSFRILKFWSPRVAEKPKIGSPIHLTTNIVERITHQQLYVLGQKHHTGGKPNEARLCAGLFSAIEQHHLPMPWKLHPILHPAAF